MSEGVIQNRKFSFVDTILLVLVLPLVFYYIYGQLRDGWARLDYYEWSLNLDYLLLSMMLAFAYFFLTVWIWQSILSYLGSELAFWKCFRMLQLAQLGKYLPGRIWAVGGQIYLGDRYGIPRQTTLWAAGLYWVFNLLCGALIFLPLLYFLVPLWTAVAATMVFLTLLGVACFPREALRFLSSLFSLAYAEKIFAGLLRFSPRQCLVVFFTFFISWSLFGLAFWSMVNAFVEVPLAAYYHALASFCGAWVLGILSFFTPAGIGVREGALVYLLGQFMQPPMTVIIPVAARLWITLVELICAGIAWLFR